MLLLVSAVHVQQKLVSNRCLYPTATLSQGQHSTGDPSLTGPTGRQVMATSLASGCRDVIGRWSYWTVSGHWSTARDATPTLAGSSFPLARWPTAGGSCNFLTRNIFVWVGCTVIQWAWQSAADVIKQPPYPPHPPQCSDTWIYAVWIFMWGDKFLWI